MNLSFGYNQGLPEGVRNAWGARLIWPDDLVWDRTDAFGKDRDFLVHWLNGGALREALTRARALAETYELNPAADQKVVLFEDSEGKIVANPNASYGYLYVAAWLHRDAKGCK